MTEAHTQRELLDDSGQREQAIDPTRSFIVQAPAGSGKTELLTQRLLSLLGTVDEPEQIAAVTFTRKAASEMRHRILGALAAAHSDTPPAPPHLRRTWELARAAHARDQARGWRLQDSPERLRVMTFDALSFAAVRQLPLHSGLGSAPGLLEQADLDEQYRQAAEATLSLMQGDDARAEAVASLLHHLDNDPGRAVRLLTGLLGKRDQWLRHLPSAGGPALRARLEAALIRLVTDMMGEAATALQAVWTALVPLVRYAAAHRDDAAGPALVALPDRPNNNAPPTEASALASWQALAELLLTAKGEWRKTVTAAQGFPAPSGTKDKNEQSTRKEHKQAMEAVLGELAADPGAAAALHRLRGLYLRYPDAQWDALEALVTLLPMAQALLQQGFAAHGSVDFTQVALSVVAALAEGARPGGTPLTHLLVDEFQDTSVVQYELLRHLIRAWPTDGSHTLFLVGDPMQSIYRFRDAEVGLFLRTQRSGLEQFQPEVLTLRRNYRSHVPVIEWVNRAFPAVLPAVADAERGAVTYSACIPAPAAPADGGVSLHPLLGRQDEVEADQVVALVQAAQARSPGESVAILVRARSHLPAILRALGAAGLRFRGVKTDALASRPVVQDLLALTHALLHPADRLAWLTVLRAPWAGLTLADLLLLAGERGRVSLWQAMGDAALTATLSPDGQARLAHVVSALAPAVTQRLRQPLHRLVEGAWLRLGGPAGLGDGELADAQALLDLLAGVSEGMELPAASVLEARLGQLFAAPDPAADETLQVMTIHQAKGLEFDTVILPGLGRQPRNAETQLLYWRERPTPAPDEALVLAPIAERGGPPDALHDTLKWLEQERERHETGRLLYVAATRARRQLHLLGHAKPGEQGPTPASGSLLAMLWPVVEAAFQRVAGAADAPPPEPAAGRTPAVLRRLPAGWHAPAPPPGLAVAIPPPPEPEREPVEYAWVGNVARHVGTVVHRALLEMTAHPDGTWEPARLAGHTPALAQHLRRLGVGAGELDDAVKRVLAALRACLDDPQGRWILSPHAEARSEWALTAMLEGIPRHVAIDRTFVDEAGIRWIIDYKTGSHAGGDVEAFLAREQERYQTQLETYARVLRLHGEQRPIRLGLYFPLLHAWRTWPAPEA